MAPKELLALRLLIDNRDGLYGSEFVHHSEGKLNRGTVYSLLERMVDKGFVREVEEPASATLNLPRTRHLITGSGRHAYNAFLAEQGLQMVPFPVAM
jgi:DNA-binding PadR family transcriptional regulator